MNPGAIFFDKEFHFHDGESGEKLFVVLGSEGGRTVVSKTTSQPARYSTVYGCQPNDRFHNFYLPKRSCHLKKPTWVCLDEFYELEGNTLLQKRFAGLVRHICDLPETITKEVQDCAILSMDITAFQESIITVSIVQPK